MNVAVAVAAVLFIYLSGRNDGGPLIAIPLQYQRRHAWAPLVFLFLSVPAVVLLGFTRVALDLEQLGAPIIEDDPARYPALVVLVAVLVTLGLSTFLNAPTSITLALIGALAGTALGIGEQAPWQPLIRIILLGILAPTVAVALAFVIRVLQRRLPFRRANAKSRLRLLQSGYFYLLAAYAGNDGQKVLFAMALALGVGVEEATERFWWVLLAALIFTFGALAGVARSGRFIRHGIARSSAGALTISEFTAGTAVFVGSFLGAPLSATQSISGGLAGTALAMSLRGVYWSGLRRVALTWVWTLPVAALVAYLMALLGRALF